MRHTGRKPAGPSKPATPETRRPEQVPDGILGLQRLVGNQAVGEILQDQADSVRGVVGSPGRPLDDDVRSDMESRLGADFSDVRVHTDRAAHDSATSIAAQAFTAGSHIAFQRGTYDTRSDAGRHVLAHELAHVVQQRQGPVEGTETGGGMSLSDPNDRHEREAERIATGAGHFSEAPTHSGGPVTAQRMMQAPAQGQAAPVTPAEVQQLQAYRAATANPQVQALLDELLPYLQQVTGWSQSPIPGGGYTRNMGGNQYEVSYSGRNAEERIAVLVHELTHVAINEAYDSDMLNYPVAPLPAGSTAADEGARQAARQAATDPALIGSYQTEAVKNVADLLERLPRAGFSPGRTQDVADKLTSHTATKPLHEYDAVLSHVLVWADQEGIPRNTPFYGRLSTLVAQASSWRAAGVITTSAPADGLGAEADRVAGARAALNPAAATAAPPPVTQGRRVLNRLARVFPRSRS